MFERIKKLFTSQKSKIPVILVGVDFSSHFVSEALNSGGDYQVIACIDDEPWNHKTEMNGAVIHYPSELLALVERHRVVAVVEFEGEEGELDQSVLNSLASQNAVYFKVPASEVLVQSKLTYILDRLSRFSCPAS